MTNKIRKQVMQWQSSPKERRRDGVFVAEGIKMFLEAPGEAVREVYVTRDIVADMPGELAEKLHGMKYEIVSTREFADISDTRTPQGILMVLKQPAYGLEELLARPNPLFVIVENLQDPGNLGTIIRTGEGAGATGVIMGGRTVDIFNPKTIRATMGSIYRVPFMYVTELSEIMDKLQEHGINTYAAHLKSDTSYDSYSFREPTAFLIGNESSGLTEELAGRADYYLKIPMEGKVESLNAAISASLLMYEAHRQRRNED